MEGSSRWWRRSSSRKSQGTSDSRWPIAIGLRLHLVETGIQAATRQNTIDNLAAEGQRRPCRSGQGRLAVQRLVATGALSIAGLRAPDRGLPALDRPDAPFEIGEMLWITSASGRCWRQARRRKRLADTGDVRSFQRAWERLFQRLEGDCRGKQCPLGR